MSVTVRDERETGQTLGHVEVTERRLRDVTAFTTEADGSVHFERRGGRTFVVSDDE